ncbi:MAG TPA: hypothetical protein VN750_12495 [Steroidobacteraceae bacterium]|nr:hypothetical protein [Steroidobacteraceae bacterium]
MSNIKHVNFGARAAPVQPAELEAIIAEQVSKGLIEAGFQRRIAEIAGREIGQRVRLSLDAFAQEVNDKGGTAHISRVGQVAAEAVIAACTVLAHSDRL